MKISTKQYAEVLYDLTCDKSNDEINVVIKRFVSTLKAGQELKNVEQIIKKFVEIYNEKNNILTAEITSSRKLNRETVTGIKTALKDKYRMDDIEIVRNIDSNIKGGIKIIVGEDILDNSIAGRLVKLRSNLIK